MPELAEVELSRRIWTPGLDHKIRAVDTHPKVRIFRDSPASEITEALTGTTFLSSRSHGKRLFCTFENSASSPLHLEIHLGMSGRLYLAAPDHPATKHDHLILRQRDLSLVLSDYRQFGRAVLHREPEPWSKLPPEVLEKAFTLPYLRRLLARRTRTCVKAILLDQSCFPGVGNWMADEICWRMRVHPAAPIAEIDLPSLLKETRFVCRGALRHIADKNESALALGRKGFAAGGYVPLVPPPSWLFQYRWKPHSSCPRCRQTLSRDTIATRTTAWCRKCQPPLASNRP
jgi:formamidopyrimidine-DNA glycosylase